MLIVFAISEEHASAFAGNEVPQTAILFVFDVDVSDLYSQAPKPNPGADFMGCHRSFPVARCWDGRSLERTARWPSAHVFWEYSLVSEIVEIDEFEDEGVVFVGDFENAVHRYLQVFGVRGGGPG
jgi:hypothetical protein